ncbi:MAG: hypothetical protein ACHQJ6_03930 [Candidatus Berkiellales bacterium]
MAINNALISPRSLLKKVAYIVAMVCIGILMAKFAYGISAFLGVFTSAAFLAPAVVTNLLFFAGIMFLATLATKGIVKAVTAIYKNALNYLRNNYFSVDKQKKGDQTNSLQKFFRGMVSAYQKKSLRRYLGEIAYSLIAKPKRFLEENTSSYQKLFENIISSIISFFVVALSMLAMARLFPIGRTDGEVILNDESAIGLTGGATLLMDTSRDVTDAINRTEAFIDEVGNYYGYSMPKHPRKASVGEPVQSSLPLKVPKPSRRFSQGASTGDA